MRVHGLIANAQGSGMYRFVIPNQLLSMRPDYQGTFSPFPPDPGVIALCDRVIFQLSHHDYQFYEAQRYRTHISKDNFQMIYEIDDLYTNLPQSITQTSHISKDSLRERRRFLSLMDGVVCSTHALKETLIEQGFTDLDIEVAENGILPVPFRTPQPQSEKPRIGFYGLSSHTKDLEEIIPIVLDTHTAYHWIFVGYCPPAIKDKVEHVEMISDFMAYLDVLTKLNLDIVLTPLEDTLFNRCKSPSKVMEAAYTGAAVIASKNEVFKGFPITYVRHLRHDFQKAIADLLADDDERMKQARALQEFVAQNHTIASRREQFERAWRIPQEKKSFEYASGVLYKLCDSTFLAPDADQPDLPIFIPALPSDPHAEHLSDRLKRNGLNPQLLVDYSSPPQGFSKTINLGIASYFSCHPESDFILLNSDTNPDPDFAKILCRDAGLNTEIDGL